jgi:hypothetical protein
VRRRKKALHFFFPLSSPWPFYNLPRTLKGIKVH